MVFTSVGLPVEGIALIMGIDRILDMTRTAVNITGDAVCTTIVAYQNKDLDVEVFNEEKEAVEINGYNIIVIIELYRKRYRDLRYPFYSKEIIFI